MSSVAVYHAGCESRTLRGAGADVADQKGRCLRNKPAGRHVSRQTENKDVGGLNHAALLLPRWYYRRLGRGEGGTWCMCEVRAKETQCPVGTRSFAMGGSGTVGLERILGVRQTEVLRTPISMKADGHIAAKLNRTNARVHLAARGMRVQHAVGFCVARPLISFIGATEKRNQEVT